MTTKFLAHGIILAVTTLTVSTGASAQPSDSIDMRGKTALVTGSTSGLGAEVAQQLGAMGATVIVHGRDAQRGAEIVAAINAAGPGNAVFYRADLASLDEVDALAQRVLENHTELHLLINNAGVGGASNAGRRESADGYEFVFAVNYLSHFHLTLELLPLLKANAPARIVNVASIGQAPIDFDDVMMEGEYNQLTAYSRSKLAQIMFTISLAEQLDSADVTVNSLHPATFMDTPMVTGAGREPISTVAEGAEAVMQLAVGTQIAGRSGLYFNQMVESEARVPQAYDAEARQRLWDISVELIRSR